MEFKLDKNEIFAVLTIFLLSIGIWQFPEKSTLPTFSAATQIQSALAGKAVPLHISFASALEQAYASLTGTAPSSPQAIVSFLLVLSPLLLALTAVIIYASLRALGFRKTISAFSSVLLSLSLSSLAFLPGVYGASQLSALLFALFLLSFSVYMAQKKTAALVPSALFAAASGYVSPEFSAAGIAAAICFAVPVHSKEKSRMAHFAIIAIIFAAAAFLSPERSALSFSAANLSNAFLLSPFLIAAASSAVALFFFSSAGIEFLLLAFAGIAVFGFSPFAGAVLLCIPAAEGMHRASESKLSPIAALACALLVAFVAIFGIAHQATDSYKAALIGLLLAPLFPLLLHFYGYRMAPMIFAMGLGLFSLSLFSAILYSLPPQHEFFPQYADSDLSSALGFLSGKDVISIGLAGRIDAARFYLPSASVLAAKDFSGYLSSGKPFPAPGSYLLLSVSQVDNPESDAAGFESYVFAGNSTAGASARYAIFVSAGGRVIAREVDPSGAFAMRDGEIIDSAGRSYGAVPLSRMLLLRPDKGYYDPENRLIVIDEGAPLPYFMKIYSGEAQELEMVRQFGKVAAYKVK